MFLTFKHGNPIELQISYHKCSRLWCLFMNLKCSHYSNLQKKCCNYPKKWIFYIKSNFMEREKNDASNLQEKWKWFILTIRKWSIIGSSVEGTLLVLMVQSGHDQSNHHNRPGGHEKDIDLVDQVYLYM